MLISFQNVDFMSYPKCEYLCYRYSHLSHYRFIGFEGENGNVRNFRYASMCKSSCSTIHAELLAVIVFDSWRPLTNILRVILGCFVYHSYYPVCITGGNLTRLSRVHCQVTPVTFFKLIYPLMSLRGNGSTVNETEWKKL